MKFSFKKYILPLLLSPILSLSAQHNYELNLEGAALTVTSGATVYVMGDVRMDDDGGGNNAAVNNSGTIEVQGHWYDEHASCTQSGTGLVWFHNDDVNTAEQQQIICQNGANLTGAAAFYDIDLNNNHATDKLVYLNGGNAEVKNTVEFFTGNRLRTANATGTDGSGYAHYFHVSNTGVGSIVNQGAAGATTAYFEGRLRRSVITANNYDFAVGIDPANAVFGNQIANVNLTGAVGASTMIEGSFTRNTGGSITGGTNCSANINCVIDHGYWNLDLISGTVAEYSETDYPRNYVSSCGGATGEFVILKRPSGGVLSDFASSYTNAQTDGNTCFDGPGNASNSLLSVTRTGFTSFSDHQIGRADSPFPVELLSFTGYNAGKKNLLQWTTTAEINSHHFEVERGHDGRVFSQIEYSVPAAGNSSVYKDYFLYDNVPLNGKNFYRLKMVDIDGTYKYSQIIELLNLNDIIPNIYPNPFVDEFYFTYPGPSTQLDFVLYDAIGRRVIEKKWQNTTFIEESFSTKDMAIGVYFYHVSSNNKDILSGKLMKN